MIDASEARQETKLAQAEGDLKVEIRGATFTIVAWLIGTLLAIAALAAGIYAYGSGQFGAGATATGAAATVATEASHKADEANEGLTALKETAAKQQETLDRILARLDAPSSEPTQ